MTSVSGPERRAAAEPGARPDGPPGPGAVQAHPPEPGPGPDGPVPPGKPRGLPLPGGKRAATGLIVTVAVIVVLVGVVIAIDSTSHRGAGAAAPRPAPAFTLPSLRDPAQQVSLSAYRGKPVIVNFFASWCVPCKKETPLLAGFYRSSRGKVVIIGVDADDSAPDARTFVTASGVAYPVAFETTPAIANAYGVSGIGIPETFFLDARHRIVKRVLGGVTRKELTAGVALMEGTQ
jgi:cytochrome c biogenesis protein CcmG, thiol:disulfide interchange protein DsbE